MDKYSNLENQIQKNKEKNIFLGQTLSSFLHGEDVKFEIYLQKENKVGEKINFVKIKDKSILRSEVKKQAGEISKILKEKTGEGFVFI